MGMPRFVSEAILAGSWTCRRCLRDRLSFTHKNDYAALSSGPFVARHFTLGNSGHCRVKNFHENYNRQSRLSAKDAPAKELRLMGLRLTVALAALTAAGSVSIFTDTAQHGYAAAQRSLRVLSALSLNVRE